MPQLNHKLAELVGGNADGKCIRIPAYATTIAVPMGRGKNYKELIYIQDEATPQRYLYQKEVDEYGYPLQLGDFYAS
jgi:hypothetical protein